MSQTFFAPATRGRRAARECFRVLPVLLPTTTLSGCGLHGAPSFVLFGAYFPAWMLLASIGILAAIGVRVGLLATGLADRLPLQLLVCVSAGSIAAILIWLVWFSV